MSPPSVVVIGQRRPWGEFGGTTPRRRKKRAAAALAATSALAGSLLLLLSDPSGLWDSSAAGRATVAKQTEEPERLLTFKMYSSSSISCADYDDEDENNGSAAGRRATDPASQFQSQRREIGVETAGGGTGHRSAAGSGAEGAERPATHEGLHFVDLYVGNPAQRRTLAVMTGSDFTAFPCGDCQDCPPSLSQFQSSFSPSFSHIECGKCFSKGMCSPDGSKCLASEKQADRSSWAGYEARDAALIGGLRSSEGTDAAVKSGFPLVFSCQTSARGRFASQVRDGIIGFSPAPTSFVAQMFGAGKLKKPRFSLCFERPKSVHELKSGAPEGEPRVGPRSDAGAVTLGGYDPSILSTSMTYAQSVADVGFGDEAGYRVFVTGIYLREGGGPSIKPDHDIGSVRLRKVVFDVPEFNSEGGGMIVDSGAPYIVLHANAEASFREMWNRSTGGSDFTSGGKVFLNDEELNKLPTIILQFMAYEGVDTSLNPNTITNMAGDLDPDRPHDTLIAIPPSNYMELNPTSGAHRARISFELFGGTVLGSNAMQGHTILYDLEKKRVGFAESITCDAEAKSEAGPYDDDMYAAEEEIGSGGIHMVEGTLNDDDLFGVPVESAAAPPAQELVQDESPSQASDSPTQDSEAPSPGVPPNKQVETAMVPPEIQGSSNSEDQTQRSSSELVLDEKTSKVKGTGTCTSVSCRVWVAVGYFFLGIVLAVTYRIAKTKEKEAQLAKDQQDMNEIEYVEGEYYDNPRRSAQKEVWEGSPAKKVLERPVEEGPVYGSEVRKDLYDLKEVDEIEYDREMPAHWR